MIRSCRLFIIILSAIIICGLVFINGNTSFFSHGEEADGEQAAIDEDGDIASTDTIDEAIHGSTDVDDAQGLLDMQSAENAGKETESKETGGVSDIEILQTIGESDLTVEDNISAGLPGDAGGVEEIGYVQTEIQPDGFQVHEGEAQQMGEDTLEVPASKELTAREVRDLLAESIVSCSGGVTCVDSSSCFAEDVADAVAHNHGASYNLWGRGTQTCSYSTKKLLEYGSTFSTVIGMETNNPGSCDVKIFLSSADEPDYEFTVSAATPPERIVLDLSGSTLMTVVSSNNSGSENTVLFYDMTLGD